MTFLPRQPTLLGQANGPEIELIVEGDEWYASYETADGHPVVYDDGVGLFCHARLVDGRFESTGVPISQPAPATSAPPHSRESPAVVAEKVAAREQMRDARGRSPERAPRSSTDGG